MRRKTVAFAATILIWLPTTALAQGDIRPAVDATHTGERTARPVNVISGGVDGFFGANQRPRFQAYVTRQHRRSFRSSHAVTIGTELPIGSIAYYNIPSEYGVYDLRYTIINDRIMLVDPHSRRVVDVID